MGTGQMIKPSEFTQTSCGHGLLIDSDIGLRTTQHQVLE